MFEQHNLDAEKSVLGSVLLDNQAFLDAQELITYSDFFVEAHQKIWSQMHKLMQQETPVDMVTLAEALGTNLNNIGGIEYLLGLPEYVPTSVFVKHYAEIVKEKSVMRELLRVGQKIIAEATTDQASKDALLKANTLLSQVNETRLQSKTSLLMDGMLERLEENKLRGTDGYGNTSIYTGIHEFDRKVQGIPRGTLTLIPARPSMGKTILGGQIGEFEAERCLKRGLGEHVFFASLEMSRGELLDRAMARRAEVPFDRVQLNKLRPFELDRVQSLTSLPLIVDDRPDLTVEEIALAVHQARRKTPISCLIVDHIHEIRWSGREGEIIELGKIAGALKALAKTLQIAVIALAQNNRGSDDSERPTMKSIRGSGVLEQKADFIIFPFRESYASKDLQDNRAELIIGKGRNILVQKIDCSFEGGYQKFGEPGKVWK